MPRVVNVHSHRKDSSELTSGAPEDLASAMNFEEFYAQVYKMKVVMSLVIRIGLI